MAALAEAAETADMFRLLLKRKTRSIKPGRDYWNFLSGFNSKIARHSISFFMAAFWKMLFESSLTTF